MKIALYIEDGREQIVLTPATETERAILGNLHDGTRSLSILRGAFYACRGGWTRQRDVSGYDRTQMRPQSDEDSTMIVLDPAPPKEDPQKAALAGIPEEFLTAAGRNAAGLPPLPVFAREDDAPTFVDDAQTSGPWNTVWNVLIGNHSTDARALRSTAYDVLRALGYRPVPSDG